MFVLKEVQLLGVEESPRQRFSQKNTFFLCISDHLIRSWTAFESQALDLLTVRHLFFNLERPKLVPHP